MAPEEEAEDASSSAERQMGEDQNELRLEDREEEHDEDDRHPLDRDEETQEADVADGNVELECEEDIRMVCPPMIDIGIDLINIIRLPPEAIMTNEHIMDSTNDLAVIEV